MKVYVIGLDRLAERREAVVARLRSLGVVPEVFAAIDGAAGQHAAFPQYDEARCVRHFGAPLFPGEVGCYASHYTLWQRCVEDNRPITVLEDDIEILPGFPEALAIAETLIAEHRLIRLAGLVEQRFRELRQMTETCTLVRFLRGPLGCQGYCLSPQGAKALVATARHWIEPVDQHIDRFWIHGVESMGLLPFPVVHGLSAALPSSIGERVANRTGVDKLRREWHRLRDDFARTLYNRRN